MEKQKAKKHEKKGGNCSPFAAMRKGWDTLGL